MSTAERIAWIAWGLMSFVILIVLLRWLGPPDEDQQNPGPSERQLRDSWLIGCLGPMLDQIGPLAALKGSLKPGGEVVAREIANRYSAKSRMLVGQCFDSVPYRWYLALFNLLAETYVW
jgi:hypothetical protein